MLEHLRKVPWEVWVGLGLTVLVAWWTTRTSVAAGQSTASGVIASEAGTGPGTSSGLGQELGTFQSQTLQAIGDLQTQQTQLANNLGTAADVTANNQSSLFGYIGSQNSALQTGLANVNSGLSAVQANTDTIPSLGASIAQVQQGVAGNGVNLSALLQQEAETQQLINQTNGQLGGSIGTAKAGILALAQAQGQGGAVQNAYTARGDYTTVSS